MLALTLVFAAPSARTATLTLSKSGPTDPVETGQQFAYELSYQCTGAGDDCEQAVITDPMPNNVEITGCLGFADHQQDGGVQCPAGPGQTATFYFSQAGEPPDAPGTLPAGSQATLTIQAKFNQGTTPDAAAVVNTATFTSSTADNDATASATTTPAAADLLTIAKTRWSGDTAKGEDTVYLIEVCQPAGANTGGLNATDLTIRDAMPEDAGFVDASDGGDLLPGSGGEPNRVVWPTTSLAVDPDGRESCLSRFVTLRYPVDLAVDQVENLAEAIYTPVGEAQKTISASITHGFVPARAGAELDKTDVFTVSGGYPIDTEPGFEWYLDPSVSGSVGLTNLAVTDPIPPQLRIDRISIGDYAPNMSVDAQYQRESDAASGTWHDFPNNPYTSPATVYHYNLSPPVSEDDQIVAVRWHYGDVPPGFQRIDDGAADSRSRFRATIQGTDRDGNPVDNGDVITNIATIAADNLDPVQVSDSVTALSELPVNPRVDKSPDINDRPYPDLSPGTEQLYTLSVRNVSATSSRLTDPVLIDSLPPQLEYVGHSVRYGWPPPADPAPSVTFDQYPHPSGAGTILRFTWSDLAIPQYQFAYIDLTVRARGGAVGMPGQYINLAAGSGYGNPNISNTGCRQTMVDEDDLDQDGDTTETLCVSRNAPFNVLASAGLDSVKEVRAGCVGSEDYGADAQGFANGPLDYRLTVANLGNVSVDSALFYDIFPYPNDTGVIDTDTPRNSDWSPVLTGAVAVPAGAVVQYSTDTNPCRPELFGALAGEAKPDGCTQGAWSVNTPADITSVRALRIDFGDITIDPEDALTLSWPMQVPVAAAPDAMGNNSFGYTATRTDGGTPALGAAEPTLVQTTIGCAETPPYIGDFVWADDNEDGIQDPGETGLNGVVVELFDAADDSLVDSTLTAPNGSGGDGFYRFGDLLTGNYYLRFTPPAGYAISLQYEGNDPEKDSDADRSTGVTQSIGIFPGEQRLDLDMGLFESDFASVGNYLWIDRNGDGLQDESPGDGLNGVPVHLLDGSGDLVAATVTADDSFGNPGYYLFRGVPEGSYSIEVDRNGSFATAFSAADQGNGSNDSRIVGEIGGVGEGAPFTVAAGDVVLNQDAGLIFPSGTLSLGDRVWFDADNDGVYEPGVGDEDGIDGVNVQLYQDTDADNAYTPGIDRFVAVATTYTKAGFAGFYEFTGLPEGDYLIRIPADNFGGDGALNGTVPTTGAPVIDPDDGNLDDDLDQNALLDADGNRVTLAMTLAAGTEPDGDHNPTLDAGFVLLADLVALGNRVWRDDGAAGGSANNGKLDGGEAGIDGVTVELYRDGSLFASSVSADGGLYWFDLLPAGDYRVVIPADQFAAGQALAGMLSAGGAGTDQSTDERDDENGIDDDDPAANGIAANTFSLAVGGAPTDDDQAGYSGLLGDASVNATADFGFAPDTLFFVALGNRVFCDEDDDGIFDDNETGIDGVTVELYAEGDDPSLVLPLGVTTTSAGGSWWFDRLSPGRYFVNLPTYVFGSGQPLDTYRSSTGAGGDDGNDDDADENGLDAGQPLSRGVASAVFDLAVGAEPTGERSQADYPGSLPDASVNGTLDLGFARDRLITCAEICDIDGSDSVTISDLRGILMRRNQRVDPPGQAGSGDCLADGVITFNDVAACRAYR